MKKLNSIQFYGMPLPIYAFFAIIVLACAYFNIIPNQMIGAVAVLFAFGILIGEIGERLPIWNKFLGGGAMLCFLAAGLLKYFNLLPECVTNVSDGTTSREPGVFSTTGRPSAISQDRKSVV